MVVSKIATYRILIRTNTHIKYQFLDTNMLSTNSGEFVDFDLTFKDLAVQAHEDPSMVIHHTIKTKTRKDNHFIKINGIEYDVRILNNDTDNELINLGVVITQIGNNFGYLHRLYICV